MPRMAGIDVNKAGLFTRIVYAIVKRKIGKLTGRAELIEPITIMAHHPRVLLGIGQMDSAQETAKSVSPRYKYLAQTRVARMVGCPF